MGFFVKKLPNICCKIGPHQFSKILYHILCTNNQMVACQKISIHLSSKRQISDDSAEIGSNLNCRCFLVCSWFLKKIIFRYISIYFIRDIPRVSQDSTPSYERSWPPFWPYFETGVRNSTKIKKMENLRIVSLYVT